MSRFVSVFVILAMVAVSAALNLSLSAREGALSMAPIYDDVGYLLDASVRLIFGGVNSIASIAVSFVASPPHAPMSTLTAISAFAMLGPHVWAPYVANAWILLAFCLLVYFSTRQFTGRGVGLLIVGIVLFVPVSHAMITEFRPDIAAGVVFSAAIYLLLRINFALADRYKLALIGLVCALAVMAKPSAFVVTIPVLGLVWMIGVARGDFRNRNNALGAATIVVSALLLLIPFAVIWGKQTIAYAFQVFFTNRDVWATDGSRLDHALYHSFGPGGGLALGPFRYFGLVIILLDIAVSLWRRRYDHTLIFYTVLATVYAGMALASEKTPHQGSFFYVPFVLATAIALAKLLRLVQRPRLTVGLLAALIAVVLPPATLFKTNQSYPNSSLMAAELSKVAATQIERCAATSPQLTAVTPYPVTPDAIALNLALSHTARLVIQQPYLVRTLDQMMEVSLASDFVLLPNEWGAEASAHLPGTAFSDAVLDYLSNSTEWESFRPNVQDAPILFFRKICR